MQISIHIEFPSCVIWEGLKATMTENWAYLAPRSLFIKPSSSKWYQGSWEKWLNLGVGQRIYRMNLECLVMLESKEMIKKLKNKNPEGLVNAKWTQEPN